MTNPIQALQDGDVGRLRHALGADSRHPGSRNGYAANKTGPDEESWRRLEAAGLAEPYYESDKHRYWLATETGIRMCGLDPMKVAL